MKKKYDVVCFYCEREFPCEVEQEDMVRWLSASAGSFVPPGATGDALSVLADGMCLDCLLKGEK